MHLQLEEDDPEYVRDCLQDDQEMWFKTHFGEEYMSKFKSLLVQTIEGLDVFKIVRGVAHQQQPVTLRNDLVRKNLTDFVGDLDNLKDLIGSMRDHEHSFHQRELNMVHTSLRKKLCNTKSNGLSCMLTSHLYEIMPESR